MTEAGDGIFRALEAGFGKIPEVVSAYLSSNLCMFHVY